MHIHAQTRHTLYRQEIFTIATGKKKTALDIVTEMLLKPNKLVW